MSDDLRALAEAATPGPWKVLVLSERGDFGSIISQYIEGIRAEDGRQVVSFTDDFGTDQPADAAYIAAASPDVVLALLDELDRLHAATTPPTDT